MMEKWVVLGCAAGSFLLAVLCITLEKCQVLIGKDRQTAQAAKEGDFLVRCPIWVPLTSWLFGLSLLLVAVYFALNGAKKSSTMMLVLQVVMLLGIVLLAGTYLLRGVKELRFSLRVEGDCFHLRQAAKPGKLTFFRRDIQRARMVRQGRQSVLVLQLPDGVNVIFHSASCINGKKIEALLQPEQQSF